MMPSKTYQYILLDWDGNIAKTLDLWLDALRAILAEEGHHPDDHELAASFGRVEDYLQSLGIKDPIGLYNRVDQLGRQKLPEVELYPETLEVLSYFKRIHKTTALITASSRSNINHLLDRHQMHELFDVIVTRDDTTEHKPHPESLNKALEALGGNAEQAIMIGDSDKDLGAAVNAGIDSLLFYPPEHQKFYDLDKLKLLNPTYIVKDFSEIMNIVK